MDCEAGVKQQRSSSSWLHLIVVGTFVFSLLAFLMALVAFLHQQGEARPIDALVVGGFQDRNTGDEYGSDRDTLLNEEMEIADTAVSGMQETQRSTRVRGGDHCISDYSANSTIKPSAHIVSGSRPAWCPVPDPVWTGAVYSILSQQWYCHLRRTPAYVKGGMFFNRTTGYLTVPVSGVYYVYSQVHLNLQSTVNKLIHKVVVTCVQCSGHPTTVMESVLVTTVPGKLHPSYQGGLLSLEEGERIGVALEYSRGVEPRNEFEFDTLWTRSFMGAFLVE